MPARRASRLGTLSQEDLARLTGYSVRTIGALEAGAGHRATPELLDAIAAALQLSADERHTLWYLAAQAPPPPCGRPATWTFAETALNAWEWFVDHPETVTSTVQDVTGAPARSFTGWAAANAAAFR